MPSAVFKFVLAKSRWTLASIIFFISSFFLLLLALLRPMDPRVALTWARYVPKLGLKSMNLKLEIRNQNYISQCHPAVLVANHQDGLDLFTCAQVLATPTVAVGKRELLYIPFFGLLFYLTGQILINRKSHSRAIDTMKQVARIAREKNVSVWMFPEGTRSRSHNLLPFKKGAFHLAIEAKFPIIPVCVSSYSKTIDISKLNPGKVLIEVLPPVETKDLTHVDTERLMKDIRHQIQTKITSLNEELLSK